MESSLEDSSSSQTQHPSSSESVSDSKSTQQESSNSGNKHEPPIVVVDKPALEETDTISQPKNSSTPDAKSKEKSGLKTPSKTKRPGPESTEKDAKKAKTSSKTDDGSKKRMFQRMWTEEEELILLEGLGSFKKIHSIFDKSEFYDYIKNAFAVDYTQDQVSNKVKKLKERYERNAKRKSFKNDHHKKLQDLSKLVWGSVDGKNGKDKGIAASSGTKTGVDGVRKDIDIDISQFVKYDRSSYGPVSVEEIEKIGLELVDGVEREELQAKWKTLKTLEFKAFVLRTGLLHEEATKILKAMNESSN